MENKVILQVSMGDNHSLEVQILNKDISPLLLVGVLEQVKLHVLNGYEPYEVPSESHQSYDA